MNVIERPFVTWLRSKMQERGLYASQLAIYLGVSHATVGHWLKGKYLPEPEHVIKLADYFKSDPDLVAEFVGHRRMKREPVDFPTYLAREFKDKPLLQKALACVYEAFEEQEKGHLPHRPR